MRLPRIAWGLLLGGGLLAVPASAKLGWRWENPFPAVDNFWSVWGTSPADVYAAGTSGTVAHFDGQSWSTVLEVWTTFYAIGGSGPSDVWAAGGGWVFHFDGSAWRRDP